MKPARVRHKTRPKRGLCKLVSFWCPLAPSWHGVCVPVGVKCDEEARVMSRQRGKVGVCLWKWWTAAKGQQCSLETCYLCAKKAVFPTLAPAENWLVGCGFVLALHWCTEPINHCSLSRPLLIWVIEDVCCWPCALWMFFVSLLSMNLS